MTDRFFNRKTHPAVQGLAALGVGAVVLLGARFLIDFFGSALPYAMPDQNAAALESEDGVVIFVFHTNRRIAALFWSRTARIAQRSARRPDVVTRALG